MKLIKKILRIFSKNKLTFLHKGNNVHIMPNSKFIHPENIYIGNNVYIASNCAFFGHGGIEIKSGTIIAHNVEILTENHNYNSKDLMSLPYDFKKFQKNVIIEENVWVGSHVKIVPGVKISEGSVIGMGAVITKDVPKYAVMGGNPAKILKYRDKNKYEILKSENKIYMDIKFKERENNLENCIGNK